MEYVNHKPGWFERLLLKLNISRFDIVKKIDGVDYLYLRRFHLLKRNKFLSKLTKGKYEGIYLHHILRPDDDRDLHDHPWNFGALILSGGYMEEIPGIVKDPRCRKFTLYPLTVEEVQHYAWRSGGPLFRRYWKLFSFRTEKAEQFHRISESGFKKTWTLFFAGPKFRKWQFMTKDGPEPYDIYLAKNCPEQLKNTDPARIDPDSI